MKKKRFKILREKYPRFIYQGYSYNCEAITRRGAAPTGFSKILNNNLKIFFDFKVEPDIYFKPEITIKNVDKKRLARIRKESLDNLIFHLGLMEIPTYWKATCSPEIVIQARNLKKSQIKWWKNLIMKGMGQFFYENRINFRTPNFIRFKVTNFYCGRKKNQLFKFFPQNRILVPVGGGKDSVVTLEILKKMKKKLGLFSLNPTSVTKKIIKIANFKNSIFVERKIDKKLLELNRRGFLNGHTPFSAYLAFLSVLVAALFGYKYIAFSNERSSNEGNVKYLGKIINHQWSKTFEFENLFREYSKKYLAKDIEYFSFLRPLYEIQIAKFFSNYPKYFSAFLSCNEAYKTDSDRKKITGRWCCNCPKCLFVFACLYPFIETRKLIKIFGKNLFEDKKLLPTMLELIGLRKFKPFECVGTKKESLVAFYLSWKKDKLEKPRFLYSPIRTNKRIVKEKLMPFLLKYFERKILSKYKNLEKEANKILNSRNKNYILPNKLLRIDIMDNPFS